MLTLAAGKLLEYIARNVGAIAAVSIALLPAAFRDRTLSPERFSFQSNTHNATMRTLEAATIAQQPAV